LLKGGFMKIIDIIKDLVDILEMYGNIDIKISILTLFISPLYLIY
jgi:hypothetical protein